MNEVTISADIIIQLLNGKPIRFTHQNEECIGDLHLTAVGENRYTAQALFPVKGIGGTTHMKALALNQQQLNTIGFSEEHGCFVGRF